MKDLRKNNPQAKIDMIAADFSVMEQVRAMADAVRSKYGKIDVLINNAGVFAAKDTLTKDGLELRFAVNTMASYILTKRLLPMMHDASRIINLSSAAQSTMNLQKLPVDILTMIPLDSPLPTPMPLIQINALRLSHVSKSSSEMK